MPDRKTPVTATSAMAHRPRIAFLCDRQNPWPLPMTGGQLRTVRLMEQCAQEFNVCLYSVSDTADLSAMGQSAALRAVSPVRILPKPRGSMAMWGSVASDVRQLFRLGLPTAVAPRGAEPTVVALRAAIAIDKPMLLWSETQRLGEIARAAGVPCIVVDLNDLEAMTLQRALRVAKPYQRRPIHRVMAWRYRRYEQQIAERFSAVWICKDADRAHLADQRPSRIFVVPNGVDLPERSMTLRVQDQPSALFVGTLSWEPNTEAIEWLINEYLPRMQLRVPNFVLNIVGRGPVPVRLHSLLAQPGVDATVSPESLASYYRSSDFVVAPIRVGGGTSIKSIEALAYQLPLIASEIAVRGLDFEAGQHFLLADTVDEFVETSLRVLDDRAAAAAVASRGHDFVASRYSWNAIGTRTRALLREVLARASDGDSGAGVPTDQVR